MTFKGIQSYIKLPNKDLADDWEKIIIAKDIKDRILSYGLLEFTLRGEVSAISVPLHGIIMLVGPPGTGKTTLARGLANSIAESFSGGDFHFMVVEPHALASAGLGRSQQAVRDLLQKTISEHTHKGQLIVLLDEVETLAPDRKRMSFEANPVDVHRATDAVLAGVDYLAQSHTNLLFIATSNFEEAVDQAFISRADLIEFIDRPDESACKAILEDTLKALAERWPKLAALIKSQEFRTAIKESVGLDGREIRKAVVGACAFSKEVALDPNKLQIDQLIASIRHKKRGGKKK